MITVTSLTKRYGPVAAVDDVTFTCEPGTITGFLGPNGAGKSTTLRMITGLAQPDAGRATIAGRVFAALPNPARIVGTLLDASALHNGRTARATLGIAATMAGVPVSRVQIVLDEVGLASAARRRVGTYSLGMRQRLALAQALIGDPEVLILDEPANGLDPEGIAWIRNLLRDFADRGGTVLLSSHLLAEVQATADHLVVISAGQIVAQGALADLLASTGLIVRAADHAGLRRLLTQCSVPFAARADGALRVDTSTGIDAGHIAALAMQAGLPLLELRAADDADLEHLFLSLTSPAATLTAKVTR
jgi:ABC-2 type transport system ATP-binding protein